MCFQVFSGIYKTYCLQACMGTPFRPDILQAGAVKRPVQLYRVHTNMQKYWNYISAMDIKYTTRILGKLTAVAALERPHWLQSAITTYRCFKDTRQLQQIVFSLRTTKAPSVLLHSHVRAFQVTMKCVRRNILASEPSHILHLGSRMFSQRQ